MYMSIGSNLVSAYKDCMPSDALKETMVENLNVAKMGSYSRTVAVRIGWDGWLFGIQWLSILT